MEEIIYKRILFITLVAIDNINDRNIYADLVRLFVKNGHHVTIVSPIERRYKSWGRLEKSKDYNILRVNTLNNQKTNIVEKGIATFTIDFLMKRAIKKHFKNNSFDLAIYSTPPVTLINTIDYIKNKYGLETYLLLKDIFPQNAVDLGLIKKRSFLHRYFRSIETKLYEISDRIGCMSQANVDYLIANNIDLEKYKVGICPNSIELSTKIFDNQKLILLRNEIGITESQRVFVYGGNLGIPQGVGFLIEILNSNKDKGDVFFIIIGSGTKYLDLLNWYQSESPSNVLVKSYIPKEEYDMYVNLADVGMIFLDYKFTIPNYPSRLLSYLESRIPILAFTDEVTDVGRNAEQRGYGMSCASNDLKRANELIEYFVNTNNVDIEKMGNIGYEYFAKNYLVQNSYKEILKIAY